VSRAERGTEGNYHMSNQTFHEIDFAAGAGTFQGSEAGEGQGYITMDGLFNVTPKGARIVLRDGKDGKRRNLSVAYTVTDNDVAGAEGTQLSQDYLLDGFIKDVQPPKPIAIQSIGRLFMQVGMTEKDAQAAMAKLPKLGGTSDRAREDAFAKAVLATIIGKTAVASVKAVAKADGMKKISVIDKFSSPAALASAKLSGNGYRLQQDHKALDAELVANRSGANRRGARGKGGIPGVAPTAPTGAPQPALDLDNLMG